jgi:hypothetical protein
MMRLRIAATLVAATLVGCSVEATEPTETVTKTVESAAEPESVGYEPV